VDVIATAIVTGATPAVTVVAATNATGDGSVNKAGIGYLSKLIKLPCQ